MYIFMYPLHVQIYKYIYVPTIEKLKCSYFWIAFACLFTA